MLYVNSCGGIPLRTGSLILAYCNVIWGTVISGNLIYVLFSIPQNGIVKTPDEETAENFLYGLLFFIFLIFFLHLVFSIVLVIGLYKKNRSMMKPFLIYSCITVMIMFISFVYSVSLYELTPLITSLILGIVLVTSLIIINSYSKTLLFQPVMAIH